jgi:uncharacterized repeat protein (TIGR03803 family)
MQSAKLRHFLPFLALLTLAFATQVQAQTYTDLFDLDGTSHGCCPVNPAAIAQGRDGNLYGTIIAGGVNGRGNIFKSTPTGTITVLHDFNTTDGSSPQGGLTLGTDGNFYGSTTFGGSHSVGTLFKVTASGTFTTIYNFTNGADAGFPHASPILGTDGKLYGVSGTGSNGLVYRSTTAGVLTPLATLGIQCDSPLVQGTDGKFYGITNLGGVNNRGQVFSVTTAGVVKTVFSFNDPTGALPFGPLLQAPDGNFYGTASIGGTNGGGVVYKLTMAGVYTVLHNFDNVNRVNGFTPTTGVVEGSDGFLYGVTSVGGASLGGTIFKVKTDSTGFAIVHNFDTSHGSGPDSMITLHTSGKIFGLTNAGGSHNDGVLYSFANNLKSFVQPVVLQSAKVGAGVGLLGQNFSTATQVLFGTGTGTFTVTGNTFINAKPVEGATTGFITVKEPGGDQLTTKKFKIAPGITSFTPTSGAVGTSVTITGTTLTGATSVKFNGKAATFTVNSDTKITATVPAGATTGKISVTTPGGSGSSTTDFTVD